jgi:hypothetical protein
MNFELRDATVSDLDACMELLASSYLYYPQRPDAAKAMWSELFLKKAGLGFVATEPERGNRVVHFGFSVFVSDDRARACRECRLPLIARRTVGEWAAGARPFLDSDEIARANAGAGLNVVGLHYGSLRGDEYFEHRLRAVSLESMRRMHAGWNLRSITVETFERADGRSRGETFGETLGFQAGHYTSEQLRAAGLTMAEAPCVWSATREESMRKFGYALAVLFGQYTPPRCGFAPHEQGILSLALEGKTDEAIASALCLSLPTVKKRFRIIYEKFRVGLAQAGLAFDLCAEGARGAETRRHLLNYLREHPEELRPCDPPRKTAAKLRAS